MDVLGVIMARSGSVGLPNKHLLPLAGRPVIAYTFDHAKASQLLGKLVVSSDSPEVLALAREAGLAALERPAALATSEASVQSVLLHAMESVESQSPFRAMGVVAIYGNVPLRGLGVIDQAVRMLFETGCDSVRSFCPVGKWHPHWMARLRPDGKVDPYVAGSTLRRNVLPAMFIHDGAVVAVNRASMLRAQAQPDDPHAFFGQDRRGFETGSLATVEIDTRADLYLAEALLRDRGGQ